MSKDALIKFINPVVAHMSTKISLRIGKEPDFPTPLLLNPESPSTDRVDPFIYANVASKVISQFSTLLIGQFSLAALAISRNLASSKLGTAAFKVRWELSISNLSGFIVTSAVALTLSGVNPFSPQIRLKAIAKQPA